MRRALLSASLLLWPLPVLALRAAAGKVDVTPDVGRRTYLAGYGAGGRRAKGVHDPLHARVLLLEDGGLRLALVAVDSIGIFREDALDLRRRAGYDREDRRLLVAATHDHSAPDTMGLWGPMAGVSGVDEDYQRGLKDKIARLVGELEGRLEEAELSVARAELDPRGLCRDTRDPVVIDPELGVLRLTARSGEAIATVVRWSCHPEVLGSDNDLVTADYPGELCARIEERGGGACVFFSGAIGGLLAPDVDRAPGLEHQFAESARIGRTVADRALAALASSGRRHPDARVGWSSRTARLPVENSRYLLFLPNLTFGHRLLDAEGRPLPSWKAYYLALRHLILFPLPERLRPWVETEVSLARIGPVRLLGVPGEIFPELVIGGYDGSRRYGHPLTQPGNPNPPDLARAPKGPYPRERLGPYGWVVGLANDEVGYIVPEYDFQVASNRAMAPRPKGTHYEETNSIGPRATGILMSAISELLP